MRIVDMLDRILEGWKWPERRWKGYIPKTCGQGSLKYTCRDTDEIGYGKECVCMSISDRYPENVMSIF